MGAPREKFVDQEVVNSSLARRGSAAYGPSSGSVMVFGRDLVAQFLAEKNGDRVDLQVDQVRLNLDGATMATVRRAPLGLRTSVLIEGPSGVSLRLKGGKIANQLLSLVDVVRDGLDDAAWDDASLIADMVNSEATRALFRETREFGAGPWHLLEAS